MGEKVGVAPLRRDDPVVAVDGSPLSRNDISNGTGRPGCRHPLGRFGDASGGVITFGMSRVFAFAASASVLSLAAIAACVGDDPSPGSGGSSSGFDAGNGSSSGDASSGGSSGTPACKGDTIDACGAACTACKAPSGGTVDCVSGTCQPKCSGSATVCGNTCVDMNTSAPNCGKCDHSCGAGQCITGVCQPFGAAPVFTNVHGIAISPSGLVISADNDVSLCDKPEGCTAATLKTIKAGLSNLESVAVVGTDVYWNSNVGDGEIVYRCPVAGCPGAGPDVIEAIVNDNIGAVVAGPTDLVWTRYQSYYGPYSHRCVLPACTTITDVRPKPSTGPYNNDAARETTVPSTIISVGAAHTLWATGGLYTDNYKQLRSCPIATSCPTPTEVDTTAYAVSALSYYKGLHYGASGAAGGGNVIFTVSDASPGARTPLVTDAAGITDLVVDASGIYWVNGTTGKVLRCATLTGCAGGGETLATGQTGAEHIRVDAKFVYWTTMTSILKVAK